LQGYRVPRTRAHIRQFTPAIYGDIRLNIRPEKNNQLFSFLDLGINLYQQDKIDERDSTRVADISHNNGFYSGIGMGYFRRMTKRGGGPYASLKMMFNWYTITAYSIVAENYDMRWWSGSGSFAFSLGFKF
ncbi:MAG: hypothetical protein K8F30_02490, partial [Taibaiella sp.]|nr:hypothetical protein [Taibaiella sp.]